MGRLSDAAGVRALKGRVAVTDEAGKTAIYDDEAAAEKAIPAGATIEHRRGAFYVKLGKPAKKASGRKPKAESGHGAAD